MDRLEKLEKGLEKLRYYKNNLSIENHTEFDVLITEMEEILKDNHRLSLNKLNYYKIIDPTDDELPF